MLVTDGEERAALAVVRSLGAAGHDVHVCSVHRRSLAGASRFCRSEKRLPDPLQTPDAYAASLRDHVSAVDATVVIPITDASLLAVLASSEALPACIPFPDLDIVRSVSDKAAVMETARRVGIAVPAQEIAHDATELARLAPVLRYPVVLKPARSVVIDNDRRLKLTVRHADSMAQLRNKARLLDPAAYPLLVQQRVEGVGIGIFLLLWEGRVLASFSHRRLREKPPAGGVSVYRESIAMDPDLLSRSCQLLDAFSWRGVAMVEYKVDRDGKPYLMEINGRFWGSLQLAVDAGVDFPVLLLAAARGGQVSPVTSYRVGLKLRWWWGDVDHLIARLCRSARDLALTDDAPSRWEALRAFLSRSDRERNEVFRRDDPRPFLRETLAWFYK